MAKRAEEVSWQSTITTDTYHQVACFITRSLGRRKNVVIHTVMEQSFHRGLCDIPSLRTLAVDCLSINSNYQELVLQFQAAHEQVCHCSSSFLRSHLTGAAFPMHSRAGDKHHAKACYTEGISRLSVTKTLRPRWG